MNGILLDKTFVIFGDYVSFMDLSAFPGLQQLFPGYRVDQRIGIGPEIGRPAFLFSKDAETWIIQPNRIDFLVRDGSKDVGKLIAFFSEKISRFGITGNRVSILSTRAFLEKDQIAQKLFGSINIISQDSTKITDVLLRFNKRKEIDEEIYNCINSFEEGLIQKDDPATKKPELQPALIMKTDINTKADNVKQRFEGDYLVKTLGVIQKLENGCVEKVEQL